MLACRVLPCRVLPYVTLLCVFISLKA